MKKSCFAEHLMQQDKRSQKRLESDGRSGNLTTDVDQGKSPLASIASATVRMASSRAASRIVTFLD